MNLPNRLTVARFLMAFAFVALMSFPHLVSLLLAYAVFVTAALTDYYDGKIARSRNLITNFGKLLDPVADKVLLVGAIVMLMGVPCLRIPSWAVVIIIAREFLITGVRSLAASGGVVIAANTWGKTKAVLQMVYVLVFLGLAICVDAIQAYERSVPWVPRLLAGLRGVVAETSFWAMVFVAVFTVYSGIQFIRLNWRSMNIEQDL